MSFVLGLTLGSRVSLSPPNLIFVESANIVSGRYAYTRDLLQLDRFTDAINPPSWSVPPSPLCLASWTEFIAAHPDQEYASYVQAGLLSGFQISFDHHSVPLQSSTRNHPSACENEGQVRGYIAAEREAGGPYASQTLPESTLVQLAWFPNLSRTKGG